MIEVSKFDNPKMPMKNARVNYKASSEKENLINILKVNPSSEECF